MSKSHYIINSIAGCTDPAASNWSPEAVIDDGTCNYVSESTEETGLTEDLQGYVGNMLSRVWGHNFKGDETEPKDWASTGYSYSGQRVSKRDISRLVSHLQLALFTFALGCIMQRQLLKSMCPMELCLRCLRFLTIAQNVLLWASRIPSTQRISGFKCALTDRACVTAAAI